jgi:hypothetical protein
MVRNFHCKFQRAEMIGAMIGSGSACQENSKPHRNCKFKQNGHLKLKEEFV